MSRFRLFLLLVFLLAVSSLPLWAGYRTERKQTGNEVNRHSAGEKKDDGSFIFRQPAMGTLFTITVYPPDKMKDTELRKYIECAWGELRRVEKTASFFDAEGELGKLNQAPANTPVTVSPELFSLVSLAYNIAVLTDGAYDPALGSLTRTWRRMKSRHEFPVERELDKARKAAGYRNLSLNPDKHTITKRVPGLLLDLGGIAKGEALDSMGRVLRRNGLTRYRLSSTSDFLAGDPPPGKKHWEIKTSYNDSIIPLKNSALSTAGTSRQNLQAGGRSYAHIIDPSTGLGYTQTAYATVCARTAAVADSLATANIFMEKNSYPEKYGVISVIRMAREEGEKHCTAPGRNRAGED